MFGEYETHFAGKPVVLWNPDMPLEPEKYTYRIGITWEEAQGDASWNDLFAQYLQNPQAGKTTGLVIGQWGEVATGDDPESVMEALASARDQLPELKAIFMGDILMEESEVSWIVLCDVSPLFTAYPRLEEFRARGGADGLSLGTLHHAHLKKLVLESGGLSPNVVREVTASQLPALEHLELWLGEPNYGGETTLEDLKPILQGDLFPRLTYLGLRNSDIADVIAEALADAPVTRRIQTLDLSLGTLSDKGLMPLLLSPTITRLKKLDLHHHFLSDEMLARLSGSPPPLETAGQLPIEMEVQAEKPLWSGIEIDVRDKKEPYDWVNEGEDGRYVAVGE